jgi:hypothetical protein
MSGMLSSEPFRITPIPQAPPQLPDALVPLLLQIGDQDRGRRSAHNLGLQRAPSAAGDSELKLSFLAGIVCSRVLQMV